MKYTVYLELSFDKKEDADALMAYATGLKSKVVEPCGESPTNLAKKCELWETHHDEDPPKQCTRLEVADLTKEA